MKKRRGYFKGKRFSNQSGQALILVLVFLLMGSLLLVPALDRISTALHTGIKYQQKSEALYAADAGIEDGIWQIKYGGLQPKFGGSESYEYDFSTNASYTLDNPVNGLQTNVTINNIWIPSNVTLADLSLTASQAQAIIDSNKLAVSGTAGAVPGQPYRIKIDFIPATGDNLTIKSVGVWLPQGFTYTGGTSNDTLEQTGHSYTKIPTVSDHCGGQAIVWNYTSYPLFTDLPNFVSENGTMTSTMYFSYTPPATDPNKMPNAIAWVTTEMHDGAGGVKTNDVPISWDVDTRIYKIISVAGSTRVEAYTSKLEIKNMGDAACGDYVATGNSLMYDASHSPPPDTGVRDTWLDHSDATVSTIPSDGDVLSAYLYWSGYKSAATSVFSDSCSSSGFTTNWQNGGDWAYYSSDGNYRGQHTGADSRRYLTINNAQNLSTYPSGTLLELTWDQSLYSLADIFSDTCSSTDFTNYWTNGGDWAYSSNKYQGQHSGVDNNTRYLTLKTGQNLSSYTSATVSWSQWKSGTLDSGDLLYFNISSDNGTTWSSNITTGSSANLTGSKVTFTYNVPTGYYTSGFKIRYYIAGFGSPKYCYLDDFAITPQYTSGDGLDFAIYDGTSWSSNIQAFRGPDDPASSFSYMIPNPSHYLNNNFKIRFYLVGMAGGGEYCSLDNIKITARPPDTSVMFKINDVQYSFDVNGDPQLGGEVTATDSSVLKNNSGTAYSYACHADVSKLVKKYPIVAGEQHHTGNAKYTVGNVSADTGNELSYAGWSIVIIYFSPQTAGHYLYLRDIFSYSSGTQDLDFDNDGTPGGDITGFVIPEPIKDKNGVITETNAATLTCFVGEGDWCYSGDYVALNAPDGLRANLKDYTNYEQYKLYDGVPLAALTGDTAKQPNSAAHPNNVWNSKSVGMSCDGVDIDTFNITWASQLLKPGDTKLHLDMYSQTDNWNLVYFIISVRSKVVTGGTGHYVITDN